MSKTENYKIALHNLLQDYSIKPSHGEIDVEIVIDKEEKHYELMLIGWDGPRRVHGTVMHLDLIDDKIWIQHDGTDRGVAYDLVDAGVPREDIILAFKPPSVWPATEYGVA